MREPQLAPADRHARVAISPERLDAIERELNLAAIAMNHRYAQRIQNRFLPSGKWRLRVRQLTLGLCALGLGCCALLIALTPAASFERQFSYFALALLLVLTWFFYRLDAIENWLQLQSRRLASRSLGYFARKTMKPARLLEPDECAYQRQDGTVHVQWLRRRPEQPSEPDAPRPILLRELSISTDKYRFALMGQHMTALCKKPKSTRPHLVVFAVGEEFARVFGTQDREVEPLPTDMAEGYSLRAPLPAK
jgi:hypothetical protein